MTGTFLGQRRRRGLAVHARPASFSDALAHCWRCSRGYLGLLGLGGLLSGAGACTDLGGKVPLPSGIPDQESLRTVAGARQLYQGAVAAFEYGVLNGNLSWGAALLSALNQGMLSDELTVNTAGGSSLDYLNGAPPADYAEDSRNLRAGTVVRRDAYGPLQTLRARAAEGIGALAQYDTSAAGKALRGHLYALTGYAELYLADLYCSGVPLSTFNYNQDFTYKAGSPTDSVYADAVRQFQQALPLLTDSVAWLNLARVGLGRAWLNLGQYGAAAAAVQPVPDSFAYQVRVDWTGGGGGAGLLLTNGYGATMADREGGIGQPYLSSHDPRTQGLFVGQAAFGGPGVSNFVGDSMFIPAKYGDGTGVAPLTVASGLEARLIRAEAALHGSGGASAMLDTLNAIRSDSGLAPIALSTGATAAVDTLFTERAAWLYLDGHRLGDLRRLLRRYGRVIQDVFPTGVYRVPVPQYPIYGLDVELPIPASEQQINPFFTGCKSRGS